MEFQEILNKFKSNKEDLIIVREGKIGIETYMHPNLKALDPSYKAQLKNFFEQIIKEMK